MAKDYDDDFDIPQFKLGKKKFKSPKYKFSKSENEGKKAFAKSYADAGNRDRAFARKLKSVSYDPDSYVKARKGLNDSYAKMDAKNGIQQHTGDTFDMGKYVKNRPNLNNKLVEK